MAFTIENRVSPFVTGLSAFLIGRDQQRRRNRQQEIANKGLVIQAGAQGFSRGSSAQLQRSLQDDQIDAQAARSQAFNERESSRQESIDERQRAQAAQQTLNARIDLLPPRAQAEYYTASQRNASILQDQNLTPDQKQQATAQNNRVIESIFQNNPPQKIQTTQDLIDQKQIIIKDDYFVMPKGYTVKERKGFIGDEGLSTSEAITEATVQIEKELKEEQARANRPFPLPNRPRFDIIQDILDNPKEMRRLAENRVINNMRGARRVDEAAVAGESPPTNAQIQQQQQQAQQQDQLVDRAFEGMQVTTTELAKFMDKSGTDPSKLSKDELVVAKEASVGLLRSLQVIGQGLTPEQREQLKPVIEYAVKVLEQKQR